MKSGEYILLDFLHAEVSQFSETIFPKKDINPVTYEGFINAPKEEVYEIASNLSYRLKINKDATRMDFENDNKLVYGELIENIYAIRKSYSYMIFEDQGKGTKLRYEAHLDMKPKIRRFLYSFIKVIIKRRQRLLFRQLKMYCESLHLNHLNQINS